MGLSSTLRGTLWAAAAAGCLLITTATAGPAMAVGQHPASVAPKATKLPLSAAQLRADQRAHNLAAGAGRGSLAGLAESAAGAPLADICVTAYGSSGSTTVITRQTGQFLFTGLRPGRYQLEYRGCDPARPYLPEWYGGSFSRSQSTTVDVTGLTAQPLQPVRLYPASASVQVPGLAFGPRDGANEMAADPFGGHLLGPVNASGLTSALAGQLPAALSARPALATAHAGKVTGRVTSPAGQDLAGVCVEVLPTGESGSFGFAQTGKHGTYSVGHLLPGSYAAVFFAQCGNNGNWLPQVYKGKSSFAHPTPIHVRAGKTAAGINAALQLGGEISGVVTGPLGKKLSDICVFPLQDTSNPDVLPVFTAVSHAGIYHIHGVPAGTYQIGFAPCGDADYSPTLWPGTQNYHAAAKIKLRPRERVGNIDEVMQLGGIISGTVTSAADPSVTLQGMCVSVFEVNGLGTGGFATTDASGAYEIKGLSPGSYQVSAQPGCGSNGNYVAEVNPGNVSIDYGQHVRNVTIALPPGAIISGTVTSAATSAPIRGICVEVDSDEWFWQVQTNASGHYSVNQLPAGQYQVEFYGGCGNSGSYAPQGYDNTSVLFPQNISAAAGQDLTGVDAAMQPGPAIAGTVTDTAGHKLTGICVYGVSPGGVQYGGAVSTHGRYDMTDLAPGPYQVLFAPGCGNNADLAGQWFPSGDNEATAALVSATSGTVHGIHGTLSPAGGIAGSLRSRSGKQLVGGCVQVTGESGAARSIPATQLPVFGSQYEISGMPLGGYQVAFQPSCFGSGYETQWYKDKPGPAHATTVHITASHISKHIDSAVIVGGTLTGRITSAGQPVHDMCVFAQDVNQFAVYGGGISNADGDYRIRGLNSGEYELYLYPCAGGKVGKLVSEVVPRLIRVTAPKHTGGVNVSVPAGATITGSVHGGSPDAAQPGVCVEAIQVDGANGGYAQTGADGSYSIANLPAGAYQLYLGDPTCSVGSPDLAAVWYPDSQTEITAGTVTVTAGGTTAAGLTTLGPDGSIAGTVTSAGAPLAGVCVSATPPGAGQVPEYAVTRSSGTYRLDDLMPGQYRVEFSSGCGATGYRAKWWHGATSAAHATPVSVTGGAVTGSIGAVLTKTK